MSPLLALPSLFGAILSLAVALALWRMRPGPSWRYGAAAGVAVAWWCAGQTAWFLVDNVELRVPIAMVQYLGVCLAPPLWATMGLAYAGRREWLTPGRLAVFFVVPVITILMAFTNESHHLLWARLLPIPGHHEIAYGPWFIVHSAYSYLMAAIGSLVVAARLMASPLYRPQLAVVLLGPGIVLAANLVYLVGKAAMPLDPTPAAFAVSFAGFGWLLVKHHFLRLVPMAREFTFEGLSDALIVLDAEARIIDTNPATEGLLGLPSASLLGARFPDVLPAVDLAALNRREAVEIRSRAGRRLEARRSRIAVTEGSDEGTVVILRDVTIERTAQEDLMRTQQELTRVNQELELLALTDALTGLANRRNLLAHLDREVARARRHARPLSFLMLDVDLFKQVNDTHGHAAGDRVLENLGRALIAQVRPGDVAARLGGEEFGVLLPETSLEEACDVARRLREELRTLPHRIPAAPDLRVTVSFGVATLAPSDPAGSALMERADAALYRTKSSGRDGVTREGADDFVRLAEEA